MKRLILMAAITCALIHSVPAAQAVPYGEWSLSYPNESKTFSHQVCLSKDGWNLMSDRPEQRVAGKWRSFDDENTKMIFEAFDRSEQAHGFVQMLSYVIDGIPDRNSMEGWNFVMLKDAKNHMTTEARRVAMTYTGKSCTPAQQSALPSVASGDAASKPEFRPLGSIGPWQIAKIFVNGKFEACTAGMNSDSGTLVISEPADKQSWYLTVLEAGGEQGAKRGMQLQFNNDGWVDVDFETDPFLGGRRSEMFEGLFGSLFGYSEMEASGEVRNSRDLQLRVGGKTMAWHLTHTFFVRDAIDHCMASETGKPAAQPWFESFSFPQTSGRMVNEFTPDKCLGAFGNGLVHLEKCEQNNNMVWIPTPANIPGGYELKNSAGGQDYCIELEKEGGLAMRVCNHSDGQTWFFHPWKEDLNHVRISNMMAGGEYCLDVVNDADKRDVRMMKCDNYSGQAWRSNTPDDMKLK